MLCRLCKGHKGAHYGGPALARGREAARQGAQQSRWNDGAEVARLRAELVKARGQCARRNTPAKGYPWREPAGAQGSAAPAAAPTTQGAKAATTGTAEQLAAQQVQTARDALERAQKARDACQSVTSVPVPHEEEAVLAARAELERLQAERQAAKSPETLLREALRGQYKAREPRDAHRASLEKAEAALLEAQEEVQKQRTWVHSLEAEMADAEVRVQRARAALAAPTAESAATAAPPAAA